MPVTIYRLFGLRLDSDVEFPELPTCEPSASVDPPRAAEPSEVTLACSGASGAAREVRANWSAWSPRLDSLRADAVADGTAQKAGDWFGVAPSSGEAEAWFDWPGVARVRICGGRRIDVDPCDGVDWPGLRSAILGPVFTVLLAQRGLYPMHASSVVMHGVAVAFAAASGSGKSTLALTLKERGYDFLSDDVTAVQLTTDAQHPVMAVPAYPQVKMLPDLIAHRGDEAAAMPRVNPIEDKRARRFSTGFRHDALPLGRVYLIEDGAAEVAGPMPSHEAFFEATRHGHRPSLLRRVLGTEEVMRRCSGIVAAVPFFRLRRPRGLERLDELIDTIEEHVGR